MYRAEYVSDKDIQRQTVNTLTPAQLAEYVPYLRFAQSTYCSAELLDDWKCGGEYSSIVYFHHPILNVIDQRHVRQSRILTSRWWEVTGMLFRGVSAVSSSCDFH